MRDRSEGVNTFSNYDSLQFYLDFTRSRTIKSFQVTFGSFMKCNEENFAPFIRKYRSDMKRFFYEKSREGYYKDKFIYLDGITDSFKLKGEGVVFNEVYLFTQEPYERNFVIDYMTGLFQELDNYHTNYKSFEFKKYKEHAKIKKEKRTQAKIG